ncbi:MAG: hypothetical protein HC825_01155 [Oscillatoriales cyanobacterium RM1_1_9]|nr:hypothetical protein [Oscillatoriales cyanobacterium RM1_1_9]
MKRLKRLKLYLRQGLNLEFSRKTTAGRLDQNLNQVGQEICLGNQSV